MSRLSPHLPPAFLLLVAALLLSGCGDGSPSPSPSSSLPSGVQGTAMIEGGPVPGGPRPMPGVTVAVHEGGLHGPIVARVKADATGAFKVDLPPGAYTLIEVSDAAVPQTVRVEAGQYVTANLVIEAM